MAKVWSISQWTPPYRRLIPFSSAAWLRLVQCLVTPFNCGQRTSSGDRPGNETWSRPWTSAIISAAVCGTYAAQSQSYNQNGVMVPAETSPARMFARMFLEGRPEEVERESPSA